MKSLKIAFVTVMVLLTSAFTSKAAPAVLTTISNVRTTPDNKLVIQPVQATGQLDVVITTKDGKTVCRKTVKGNDNAIPLNKLQQGKYKVNIKSANSQQSVNLVIL